MKLRDYQRKAIAAIRFELRREMRSLAVLGTGSGKTVILAHLVSELLKVAPQYRVLFIVHKIILSKQIEETLKVVGVECGVYCGGLSRYEMKQVTVGLYQSLAGQPNMGEYDFIIIDECHRLSDSYKTIIERVSTGTTRLLGVTATPYQAKGHIFGDKKFWPKPCFTKGVGELTGEGWLVRAISSAPIDRAKWVNTKGLKLHGGDFSAEQVSKRAVKQELVEVQVADALPKLSGRHHVAWCCCNIEHARLVEMELAGMGQSSGVVTSQESKLEQDEALRHFRSGRIRHLVFVMILVEGFDEPSIDAIVILRPMRSPTLYVQCIGRGLRLHDDKDNCLVLDYGGAIEALGPIDNPVILEPREGNHEKKLMARSVTEQWMQCKECGGFFSQDIDRPKVCPECGSDMSQAQLKERLKKLKKVSSSASLYSKAGSIDWDIVRSYSFHKGAECIDFIFSTDSGDKKLRLDVPNPARSPTPQQMGKMRKAKRYLELFFGCRGHNLQSKAMQLGESQIYPKYVACLEGSSIVLELSDPIDPNAVMQPVARVYQESLL